MFTKWLPFSLLLITIASITYSQITYSQTNLANHTEELQLSSLYTFTEQWSDFTPDVSIKQSSPYKSYQDKDDFERMAEQFREALRLNRDDFLTEADNQALTYTASASFEGGIHVNFKLYGTPSHESFIILNIKTTPPNTNESKTNQQLLFIQDDIHQILLSYSIKPFWTIFVKGSIEDESHPLASIHSSISDQLIKTFPILKNGYYADKNTVDQTYLESATNRNLQLKIHRNTETNTKHIQFSMYP